jgi:phospholipase/carboxylesterase
VHGDALLSLPERPAGKTPVPFVLLLHGAGGTARHGLSVLAEPAGLALLAPSSAGRTWDLLEGGLGPDVGVIDTALGEAFDRVAVDPARVAIGGFSDGASYALSLGLGNGDLFSHVLAFSPGFASPVARRGRPRVFVSHGLDDRVLPIERCSRQVVPRLRGAGYDVRYREFDGPHTVTPGIAAEAVAWFTGT